jgi:adenine-specific DNA-methyltransferase
VTELVFKGKEFVWNHHLAVPARPLVPQPEKGIGEVRLDGNLIVQGDNLHALKALLPMYAGKVDCIFIDPPYNTGNEGWSYNDNVNAPMIKEWLEANPIGIEDGLRHDKWCAMMWPRLRLLHELLADTGSLWLTLDDNEVGRAVQMLNEIFGEGCHVATVIWHKADSPKNTAKQFSVDHDYLLVFSKDRGEWEPNLLDRSQAMLDRYQNPDNDPRGPWMLSDLDARNFYSKGTYAIQVPGGELIPGPPAGRYWSVSEDKFWDLNRDKRIWWGEDGKSAPNIKRFLSEVREGVIPQTLWPWRLAGSTRHSKAELVKIMGGAEEDVFVTPKPTKLLSRVMAIATNKDSIVLDSFAGSGTTAHAVLEANKRDGGNRRFILVEMEDYADRLTAERVRRVINGYDFKGTQKTELLRERLSWRAIEKADALVHMVEGIENLHGHEFDKIKKEVKDSELVVTGEKTVAERTEGLGGSFTYCTLGQPVELDAILTGQDLPGFDALGGILFHMATSQPVPPGQMDADSFHVGMVNSTRVWLIYRPDLDWLKSPDAALPDDRHLVLAPARYVSQRLLDAEGLAVEFVPLPFALYRVERV